MKVLIRKMRESETLIESMKKMAQGSGEIESEYRGIYRGRLYNSAVNRKNEIQLMSEWGQAYNNGVKEMTSNMFAIADETILVTLIDN